MMTREDRKNVLLTSLKEIRQTRAELLETIKELNRLESEYVRVLELYGEYVPTASDPLAQRGNHEQ